MQNSAKTSKIRGRRCYSWNYSFSTYVRFSEKLKFLNPCIRVRSKISCINYLIKTNTHTHTNIQINKKSSSSDKKSNSLNFFTFLIIQKNGIWGRLSRTTYNCCKWIKPSTWSPVFFFQQEFSGMEKCLVNKTFSVHNLINPLTCN